jgi:hypothetical protein
MTHQYLCSMFTFDKCCYGNPPTGFCSNVELLLLFFPLIFMQQQKIMLVFAPETLLWIKKKCFGTVSPYADQRDAILRVLKCFTPDPSRTVSNDSRSRAQPQVEAFQSPPCSYATSLSGWGRAQLFNIKLTNESFLWRTFYAERLLGQRDPTVIGSNYHVIFSALFSSKNLLCHFQPPILSHTFFFLQRRPVTRVS